MNFEFSTAGKIIFGAGTLGSVGGHAHKLGTRALVCTGVSGAPADSLLQLLSQAQIPAFVFPVTEEPTIESASSAVALAIENQCDMLIGIGGGSAMDTAKAVAALATNPGEITAYLEVIGAGKPLLNASLPCIAIPTTSGTGAEVTRNAVLGSKAQRVKVSLRSETMLPRLALVDPSLTVDLPPPLTASTGLDALTQLIEPFISNAANVFTDPFCRAGLLRAAWALPVVFDNGRDLAARADMSLASLYGGLALANAKLGAVHGIAGPFGGAYLAPHGAVCGRLLPEALRVNLAALRQRNPNHPSVARYEELAAILTGRPTARAEDGVAWVARLVEMLEIPRLSSYGFKLFTLDELVEKSQKASSMKGNPIPLTDDEVREIVVGAY